MDKEKILTQENMIEKFYANQSKVKLYKKITKVKAKLAKSINFIVFFIFLIIRI